MDVAGGAQSADRGVDADSGASHVDGLATW
jgi:hypothetical protein